MFTTVTHHHLYNRLQPGHHVTVIRRLPPYCGVPILPFRSVARRATSSYTNFHNFESQPATSIVSGDLTVSR